jgi:hypothetical protein
MGKTKRRQTHAPPLHHQKKATEKQSHIFPYGVCVCVCAYTELFKTMTRQRGNDTYNSIATRVPVASFLFFFCVLLSVVFTEVRAASWDGTCEGPTCPSIMCGSTECKNGAYCDPDNTALCLCPPGYGKSDCSVEINACTGGVTCYNGGLCPIAGSGSGCRCDPHYTGNQCQTEVQNIQDCGEGNNHYCLNSGVCNTGGLASCTCTGGYAGEHCEKAVNKCDEFHPVAYCENGGECTGSGCNCVSGYYGAQCEKVGIDPLGSSSSSSSKYTKKELAIGFAVVIVLLVLAIVGTVCCVKRRQKRRNAQSIRSATWNANPGPGAYVYENGAQLDYRTEERKNVQEIEMGGSPQATFHTPIGGDHRPQATTATPSNAARAYQPPDDQFSSGGAYAVDSPSEIPNPVSAALALARKDQEGG